MIGTVVNFVISAVKTPMGKRVIAISGTVGARAVLGKGHGADDLLARPLIE